MPPTQAPERAFPGTEDHRTVDDVDAMIKAANADVAPRITPDDVRANIASEHYFTADEANFGHQYLRTVKENGGVIDHEASTNHHSALKLLTFCVLVLRNGFTVTGESACASPANFNAEIGRKIARDNAVSKIWTLMGYQLRSQLTDEFKAGLTD